MSKIKEFFTNKLLVTAVELAVVLAIGVVTISEAKKTGAETRAVLRETKEELKAFASTKTEQVEEATKDTFNKLKDKYLPERGNTDDTF
jgi:hypothetical protein